MNLRKSTTAVLAVAALGFAGCGDDDEDESAATTEAPAATQEAAPPAAEAPEQPTEDFDVEPIASEISEDLDSKPQVPMPEGAPPADLVSEDIVEGEGEPLRAGDTANVMYVGVSFATGQEFDSSWEGGQPVPFPIGQMAVIPGFDEGLVGMRPGGRRLLVIPPELGYGAQGAPPAIGPNETLIFVVDLIGTA